MSMVDPSPWTSASYDERFNNPQGEREDKQILLALRRFINANKADFWVDIGCGTGMVYSMLEGSGWEKQLVSLDRDQDMVLKARSRFTSGVFVQKDAEDVDEWAVESGLISLFANQYFSERTFKAIVDHPGPVFMVGMDKPWRPGSLSYYNHWTEEEFNEQFPIAHKHKLILESGGFKVKNLLDQPFYYVAQRGKTERSDRESD